MYVYNTFLVLVEYWCSTTFFGQSSLSTIQPCYSFSLESNHKCQWLAAEVLLVKLILAFEAFQSIVRHRCSKLWNVFWVGSFIKNFMLLTYVICITQCTLNTTLSGHLIQPHLIWKGIAAVCLLICGGGLKLWRSFHVEIFFVNHAHYIHNSTNSILMDFLLLLLL